MPATRRASHVTANPTPLPAERARALRAAPNDTARVFARNRLAGSVRELCLFVLELSGVTHEAEDLANTMVCDLVSRIERGEVAAGKEDGYVAQAARNRALDHFRHESGVRVRATFCGVPKDIPAERPTALELMVAHEEHEEHLRRVAELRALIGQAPESYGRVLHHVYVEGRPIEELVMAELARRCARPTNLVERQRARDSIDKVLQRARQWMGVRLGFPRQRG